MARPHRGRPNWEPLSRPVQKLGQLLADLRARQMRVDVRMALAPQSGPHLVDGGALGGDLIGPLDDAFVHGQACNRVHSSRETNWIMAVKPMRNFSLNSREFYEAVCAPRQRPWIPNGALPREPVRAT